MAGARRITIEILGKADSAKRAFNETSKAANGMVPSSLNAEKHLGALGDTLANRLPVGGNLARNAVGQVTGALSTLGPVGQGAAAGAAVVGGTLVKMAADGVQSFLSLSAEARTYKRVTAASAEDSSKLAAAMRAMGVDAQTGSGLMGRLAKNIGTNAQALEQNGIAIAKNRDGSVNMSATLENIAERFKNSTSATDRATLGAAAFGRGWVTLSPILSKGKDGIHDLYAEAERHHEIFNDSELQQGVEFQKSMRELKASVESLERSIGQGLVPVLTDLLTTAEPVINTMDTLNRHFHLVEGGLTGMIGGLIPGGSLLTAFSGHGKKAADTTAELAGAAGDATTQEDELGQETDDLAASEKAAADAADTQAKAIDKVIEASLSAISSTLGLEGATDRSEQATTEYNAALLLNEQQHGRNAVASEDLRDKGLALKEALVSQAQAAVKVAEDQATANGQILSASQKAQIFKDQLTLLAANIQGPVHDQLVILAASIQNIPADKTTNFHANTAQAQSDIIALANATAALRGYGWQPGDFDVAAGAGIRRDVGHRAAGGPVGAGRSYIVGEHGPELVTFGASGMVTPNGALGGGGNSYAISVTAIDPASASAAVVRAIQEYERRNGRTWRS